MHKGLLLKKKPVPDAAFLACRALVGPFNLSFSWISRAKKGSSQPARGKAEEGISTTGAWRGITKNKRFFGLIRHEEFPGKSLIHTPYCHQLSSF